MAKQMECRIVITHDAEADVRRQQMFEIGMFDPISGKYEPLGRHPFRQIDSIVRGLKERIEREGHLLTFSERRGLR